MLSQFSQCNVGIMIQVLSLMATHSQVNSFFMKETHSVTSLFRCNRELVQKNMQMELRSIDQNKEVEGKGWRKVV